MTLGRHARGYLVIGGVQWLVDWGVMVLFSHWGMVIELANVLGRVAGALLGYWLNGKFTFAADHTDVGRKQLVRFIVMWLCTTTVSTLSMGAIDDAFGFEVGVAREGRRGVRAGDLRVPAVAALGLPQVTTIAANKNAGARPAFSFYFSVARAGANLSA
jgi:putative flippase GtrA